jgi:RNA polymerase sigma-70 factor (ECF subfamily)
LIRFATLLVGPNDAADAVSAAFLNVVRRADLDRVDNLRAYLYRSVSNAAADQSRNSLRRQRREVSAASPQPPEVIADRTDLRGAVARLSVRQRTVVYFTYWEDMSEADIAAALDVSQGAIRRHLARARQHLRKALT